MKKAESSRTITKTNFSDKEKDTKEEKKSSAIELMTKEWHKEIEKLSYEQSLKALDSLLEDLQNDTVPVEDLRMNYLKGNIYLDHCERLLKTVEQQVIELKPEEQK